MGAIKRMDIKMEFMKNGRKKTKHFPTYSHLGKFITENHYRMRILDIKIKGGYFGEESKKNENISHATTRSTRPNNKQVRSNR